MFYSLIFARVEHCINHRILADNLNAVLHCIVTCSCSRGKVGLDARFFIGFVTIHAAPPFFQSGSHISRTFLNNAERPNAAIVAIAGQLNLHRFTKQPQAQNIPKTAALAIRYKLHCWAYTRLFTPASIFACTKWNGLDFINLAGALVGQATLLGFLRCAKTTSCLPFLM
ncbi:MAG: hypothetical protein ACK2U6_14290 [Candidatus Promineifilaceae bacterium]